MCVAVVALARCGHPLRFYITPHCPQCQPVSRKLLLWSTPLRALRVKATGVMQNCLRWVRLSWRCGISQALRAVFLVSGLRPVMLCVPRPPCGLAAARHWPCAGLPVRPQGAQLSPARREGVTGGTPPCHRTPCSRIATSPVQVPCRNTDFCIAPICAYSVSPTSDASKF